VRELWSSAEQQQNYLMGVPEGADLMITPVSEPENHYLKISGTSGIDAEGNLTGEIYITAEGQTDAAIRGMFTRDYRSEWDNNLEAEFLRVHPKAEIISMDYGENPYNHAAGPIEIRVKYRIPDYAFVGEGHIAFVPFVASNIFGRAMSHLYLKTSLDERKDSFRDRCSRIVNLDETITLPQGFTMRNEASDIDFDDAAAAYEGKISQEGNTLNMHQEIILEKRIYEADEWPAVKKVVEAQDNMAHTPIILYK
jgi:hypothetical protein